MWLAVAADPLTLPGYGLAGIVISGLSVAVLKLYNANTKLHEERTARERETADTTIPLLVRAVELLSATAPHIDRAAGHEDEITETLRRVDAFLKDFDPKRGRPRGT